MVSGILGMMLILRPVKGRVRFIVIPAKRSASRDRYRMDARILAIPDNARSVFGTTGPPANGAKARRDNEQSVAAQDPVRPLRETGLTRPLPDLFPLIIWLAWGLRGENADRRVWAEPGAKISKRH